MKTISTTELRTKTRSLVRALAGGKAVELTYRGHKIAQIFPVSRSNAVSANDSLYQFHRHATHHTSAVRELERMRR